MLKPTGGSIATWGPTGLSINSEAKVFCAGFFESTFQNRERILSASILDEHNCYGPDRDQFMHRIYNLLGDPARMR